MGLNDIDRMIQGLGFAPQRTSHGLGWRKGVVHAWYGVNQDSIFDALSSPTLFCHLGGAANVPLRVDRRWLEQPSQPGCFSLIPPDVPTRWRVNGITDAITIHLGRECFDGLLEMTREALIAKLPIRCGERDTVIGGLIATLVREVRQPGEVGALVVDAIMDSIVLNLLRGTGRSGQVPARGGLSPRTLRSSIERIEASIEHGVSLQELASEAGLSRAHFSKAFRQSTGFSPHRYLLKCRIDKAKIKLSGTKVSLSEIALGCGFSSQAHFTEYFRREVGSTPLSYRQTATALC